MAVLVLFYKIQNKNYLMIYIGKYFSRSKKHHLSDNSKEEIDPKKAKEANQAAVTGTMMLLKKLWTVQIV